MWKYQIIEYEYKSLGYSDGGVIEKTVKSIHKTNSKLLFILIKLCMKINKIKYEEVIK